jgi:hypothetical protein
VGYDLLSSTISTIVSVHITSDKKEVLSAYSDYQINMNITSNLCSFRMVFCHITLVFKKVCAIITINTRLIGVV